MQISRPGSNFGSDVRERSGWLLPIAFFLAVAVLSALFLLYYLAPNPANLIEEHESPNSRTSLVHLKIGDLALIVPENYLQYASARRGGTRREIALFAKLPEMSGYSEPDAWTFSENGTHSPVIHILVREDGSGVAETARLRRIYLNEVQDPHGQPGPFGLLEYAFRDDSGYRGEDLLVGHADGRTIVMRCARPAADLPNPSCQRELPLPHGAALSYRFVRSRLAEWRGIARGVDNLVMRFATERS
jgi:hypothetical protein